MLPEAELFVLAEWMLVEVLGRIRPEDEGIVLPPMPPGSAEPTTLARAVEQHLRADALVPLVLAGRLGATGEPAPHDGNGVRETADLACAAAVQAADGDALVPTPDGELAVAEYLLRSTMQRSLLAHYVAAYLGSTACPLPEELARPLWELSAPDAGRWRQLGYFREPMPLPPHVSWRDRFLLTAGHEPHPLGH